MIDCGGFGLKGNRGWIVTGFVVVANWFAESLALSSANASQKALWVMKLSFLFIIHIHENSQQRKTREFLVRKRNI